MSYVLGSHVGLDLKLFIKESKTREDIKSDIQNNLMPRTNDMLGSKVDKPLRILILSSSMYEKKYLQSFLA